MPPGRGRRRTASRSSTGNSGNALDCIRHRESRGQYDVVNSVVGCRRRVPVHARDVEHERGIGRPHRSRRREPRQREPGRPGRDGAAPARHAGAPTVGRQLWVTITFFRSRAKVAAVTAAIVGITGAAVAFSIEPTAGAFPSAPPSHRQPEGTAGTRSARRCGRGTGAGPGRADDPRLPGRAGGGATRRDRGRGRGVLPPEDRCELGRHRALRDRRELVDARRELLRWPRVLQRYVELVRRPAVRIERRTAPRVSSRSSWPSACTRATDSAVGAVARTADPGRPG